ncbi:MAG: hypothetical protein LBR95_02535 [Azoarcus sp.]|nr:hypothetical protein [Azoarcus sp.]
MRLKGGLQEAHQQALVVHQALENGVVPRLQEFARHLFARGDGQEISNTAGSQEAIQFAEGIAPDDIWAQRSGNSLVFKLAGSTDQITVSSFFSNAAYKIEKVRFADGTMWDQADLLEIVGIQSST